ncbi:cation:proton antiporter [Crocinitomicaceae bacterium]|nr:cation:proton antiporter [Crocinitomicaceae bacterium]
MTPYFLIIALAGIIILSFFFNVISEKTNIPSVLMLIGLGMGLKAWMTSQGIIDDDLELDSILEVLGNVGLVMIVLEAALDLKLERDKRGLILRSFLIALLGIGGSMFALGGFFMYIFPDTSLYTAIIYAIPLSIMSSAIIIPSVGRLIENKREFMVYESTFSDILGIMTFYFMIGADGGAGGGSLILEISLNVLGTIVLSVIVAYVMVYLFQHLQMQVKLFLIIGILMLLFAVGKIFHLSSLLLILTFGLVLNNTDLFFQGRLSKIFDKEKVKPILHDFHTLTLESAFLIRTFFFVIFGLSISISSLYNFEVAINSAVIVAVLYCIRYLLLRVFGKGHMFPEVFIAPRGLITVLLFFVVAKNDSFTIENFDTGLLLYPILITSMIMMVALITYRGEKVTDVLFQKLPLRKNNKEDKESMVK